MSPDPADNRFARDPELVEHLLDLRPAAVDDDRVDLGLLQQRDVARKTLLRAGVAHGVAAIFHHDDLVVIALHVRQRLHENARLLVRVGGNVRGRSGGFGVHLAFRRSLLEIKPGERKRK